MSSRTSIRTHIDMRTLTQKIQTYTYAHMHFNLRNPSARGKHLYSFILHFSCWFFSIVVSDSTQSYEAISPALICNELFIWPNYLVSFMQGCVTRGMQKAFTAVAWQGFRGTCRWHKGHAWCSRCFPALVTSDRCKGDALLNPPPLLLPSLLSLSFRGRSNFCTGLILY